MYFDHDVTFIDQKKQENTSKSRDSWWNEPASHLD